MYDYDTVLQSSEVKAKFDRDIDTVLSLLIPDLIGSAFKAAMEKGNREKAVSEAAAYFRRKPDFGIDAGEEKNCSVADAEKTLSGVMREVNVDWTFENGKVDFLFDPTSVKPPRNNEWLWQFNRHGFWKNLGYTYAVTKEEKYARAYREQILRFIAETDTGKYGIPDNLPQSPLPETRVDGIWNAPGSAWRTIECGIRLSSSWPQAFNAFRVSPSLSDSDLLIIIASMHRQALHLMIHPTSRNWLALETNGAYLYAMLFPELKDSEIIADTACRRMVREFLSQMLPDGYQNELSPDYHSAVFHCAITVYETACRFGKADSLPPAYVPLLSKAIDAYIDTATPAFTQPRTNDCFTLPTDCLAAFGATYFPENGSYRFAHTDRREGTPPAGVTASRFLPYAGFCVMRSDWGKDAAYLMFDVGPLGNAHAHQDKLNIHLYKGGEELIFDDGGGQYEISDARDYAISGFDHNTVLVDGLAQMRESPAVSDKPIDAGYITNDVFDYAYGVYEDGFGSPEHKPATHKREIRFVKPGFFAVKDTLTPRDGKTHSYELLFHLNTVKADIMDSPCNAVLSDFGKTHDVYILPLYDKSEKPDKPNGIKETVTAVSARTKPSYRGFYVGRNEENVHPALTVGRKIENAAEYTFVTLLFPVKRGSPLPTAEIKNGNVTVLWKKKEYVFDISEMNR